MEGSAEAQGMVLVVLLCYEIGTDTTYYLDFKLRKNMIASYLVQYKFLFKKTCIVKKNY